VLAESDLQGNITNEYVFFAGRRIAQRTSSGSVYFYYADALGTVHTITDGTGQACYDATFTPYGQEMLNPNISQTCSSNYKFAGYEYDSETGLYYANARYYNPRLGRFMSPDPLSGDVTDPQSLNSYAYVENDPTNWTDPSGTIRTPWGYWGPGPAEMEGVFANEFQLVFPFECDEVCETGFFPGALDWLNSLPLGVPPNLPRGLIGPPFNPPPPQTPCTLSTAQRISLGIQGALNAIIGAYKAFQGAILTAGGLGLAPASDGVSLVDAAGGAYLLSAGGGQTASGIFQLGRMFTGNGGPETTGEQYAAIAQGPISGVALLASGFGPSDAERAANFESMFTAGSGLINSPEVSSVIDAGLTALRISNAGGCHQ